MIKYLLQRPISVLTTLFAILILGVVAALKLPISLMPAIEIPKISILYSYSQLSADQIENLVTTPLRNALRQIHGLDDMSTTSEDGKGEVRLSFKLGNTVDYAFLEVNQRVDKVMGNLGTNFARPNILKASTSDVPVLYINAVVDDIDGGTDANTTFYEFGNLVSNVLVKRLEQLSEISMVDVHGLYAHEVLLLPKVALLETLGISHNSLITAINSQNSIHGSLSIHDGHYKYEVRLDSQLNSKEEVEDLSLVINNRLFKIKDLADVTYVPRNKIGLYVTEKGESVSLAIIKHPDVRLEKLKKRVSSVLKTFSDDYPEIKLQIVRDQSQLLEYSISSLQQSLIIGVILAIIIMVFFLKDVRSPLIIAISIPLSMIVVMLFLYVLNISINIISLSGLILGAGMMVDNSIIVIDNINQHRSRGGTIFDACNFGTLEMTRPLLSSVLTTCAVFLPLIFIGDMAGALFYEQAMAVSIGLFVSFFVSITVVPVIFHLLLRNVHESRFNNFIRRISWKNPEYYYERVFNKVFPYRRLLMTISLIILMLGGLISQYLKVEYMPIVKMSDGFLFVDWNEPINLDENNRRCDIFLEQFMPLSSVINCCVGEKQYLLQDDYTQRGNEAEFYLKCKDSHILEQVLDSLEYCIKQSYPMAVIERRRVKNPFEQLFAPMKYDLIAHVGKVGDRNLLSYTECKEFTEVLQKENPSIAIGLPASTMRIILNLNMERMLLYGVTQSDIAKELETKIGKLSVDKLNTGNQYLPIVMAYEEKAFMNILQKSTVKGNGGASYPLSVFISLSRQHDFKEIYGMKGGAGRVLYINVNDAPVEQSIKNINEVARRQNIDMHLLGRVLQGKDAIMRLVGIVVLSILLLYFILASQFESLKIPFIILLELPIDIAFTLIVLFILGVSVNLLSMIGIVVMCGIVINDSILKINTIVTLERSGYGLMDAIHIAGIRRLRPILMTSLTTIMSLIPMLFGDSIGTQIQYPFIITLFVGTIIGTFVSLFWIPVCYYYFNFKLKAMTKSNLVDSLQS
ncbi:MAG: efflux RND transporter permease subunit [Marinifilaceae bacterium]